jgi:membrane protease YdiL (CAAX protease family)
MSDPPPAADDTAVADQTGGAADGVIPVPVRTLLVAVTLALAGPLLGLGLSFGLASAVNFAGVTLPLLAAVGLLLVVTQWGGFGGVVAIYLRRRGEALSALGFRWLSLREFALVAGGVVVAFVLSIGGSIVLSALSVEGASNQAADLGQQDPAVFLLLIPAAFLVIGPCEELLFRGVVQRRLRESFGPAVAVVVAAALFASIHFFALNGPSLARLASISVLFFPSLVLGATYEYTGNLVVPILIHSLYDAVIFAALYAVFAYGPPPA